MIVDDLIKQSNSWISTRESSGVVISSRIRLARNVSGVAFPGWAGSEDRRKLFDDLSMALASLDLMEDAVVLPVDEFNEVDRVVLCERRLISRDMIEKGAGSGLVVSAKQRVAVMINEEDHLRMQLIRPGLNLRSAWKLLDRIDTELEKHVSYAFSPDFGYLTACPSNVGIGMRVSIMVHLPGLKLMDEIDSVVTGLNRMGMAVRGTFGEGSDTFGNMYQVSNETTLGVTEVDTVNLIHDIAGTLVELEQSARARLMQKREIYLRDYIHRAFGISMYAQVTSSGEALDLLSALRLGLEFGMLTGVTLSRINKLMLLVQPGHLQKNAKDRLSVDERDELRADVMRKKLKGIELVR